MNPTTIFICIISLVGIVTWLMIMAANQCREIYSNIYILKVDVKYGDVLIPAGTITEGLTDDEAREAITEATNYYACPVDESWWVAIKYKGQVKLIEKFKVTKLR